MGIIVNKKTRVIVQGITGTQGRFHSKRMIEYGTKIVAGVTPGKSHMKIHGIPVYDTVEAALEEHTANTSIIFVPAPFAAEAALEALENKLKTIAIITEHIPVKDAINLMAEVKKQQNIIIGPNTPGIITPGECKLGIMPSQIFRTGEVGMISRSGTLTYEIAASLSKRKLGQSTCIGLGGDPITGLNFIDVLEMFKEDPQTKAVVLIGEIGGNLEELTATYIEKARYSKPVVAFIAGRSAPPGKRMGHAGAIITGHAGTAESKINAFRRADVKVAEKPSDITGLLWSELKNRR